MHFLKIVVFLFFFVSFLKVFVGSYLWAMEESDNTSTTAPIHLIQKKNDDDLDETTTKNKASIQNVNKPQNQIGKLTREECLKLKEVCLLFSTISIPGEKGEQPLKSRLGWINPDALDELKPLCYLDAKNWKDSKDLKGQMQKAVRCFYHLTENIVFMGVIEGTKNLSKNVSTNQDIVQLFSGLQRSFPTAIKEIDPFIPILQKMMRNIVRYFKETIESTLDSQSGTIPISNDQILGYIEGYFPIVFGSSPHYEEIRMPYARYLNQSLCLVKNGQIVSDTGIFLVHKGFSGISLMKNAFMYYGAKNECPFTMSPLELFSFTLLKNENTTEKQLRLILDEEFPVPGESTFIPLPQTQQEKDIIELLFLEDLQEKGKTGDTEALKMISYIEEEMEQPLEKIIEALTEDQLKILEQQEKVSKAVSENQIQGRLKREKPSSQKKKTTKSLQRNKQEVLPKQQEASQNLDKVELRQNLKSLINTKRVKYKKVLEVINRAMKHAVAHNLMEGTTGGSHKTLHSDKGAVTSVRPHGKKSMTIPGQKVKRFTEKLLGILDLK